MDAVTPPGADSQTTQPGGATPPDRPPARDAQRIAPRSPRAALEPERIPEPTARYSRRARHPLVIVGNFIITIVLVVGVVAAAATAIGKQRFEAAGPLDRERVVNIPRGGIRDTADLLMREGVIDQPSLFIAGALIFKTQSELKYGEYKFTRNPSLRDVVDTIIEGKVIQHAFTIPEGLTST